VYPDETLAFDVPLGGGVNAVQLLGHRPLLKFGRAKHVKNRRDLRQLSRLSANISGTDEDSDNL